MKKLLSCMFLLYVPLCFAQAKVKTTPSIPDLSNGEKLYQNNCSMCHGAKGMSETTLGKTMKKKPAAIGDPVVLNRLSPEKVFEVLSQGIPDASMPSYKHLSDKDRWDLAAYIFTLNCNSQRPTMDARPSLTWSETRTQTDLQIVDTLKKRGVPEKAIQKELSAARYLLE